MLCCGVSSVGPIRGSGSRSRIGSRLRCGSRRGESNAEIARGLGRHRSHDRAGARCGAGAGVVTMRRSLAERRSATVGVSAEADEAVQPARGCWRRSRQGCRKRWSPEQISATLQVDYPGDLEMRISPETIYLSLFVQSRGELRRQLTAELRTGRKARKPQGQVQRRGRISGHGQYLPAARRRLRTVRFLVIGKGT